MTLKEAIKIVREAGCTIRSRDGEYRVNFKNGSEESAYYTNDLEDAVGTAKAMQEWKRGLH